MGKDKNSKQDNFLLYVPQKKHEKWELRKDGKVYLIFNHDKPAERFARWLVKKPTVSDIELDKLGTKVWMAINGENSVYDIMKILQDIEDDTCESITQRLIMYLRHLNKKGWITFDKGNQ